MARKVSLDKRPYHSEIQNVESLCYNEHKHHG